MTTGRIATIIKESTQAAWFDCVEAANNIQIGLTVEKKKWRKNNI